MTPAGTATEVTAHGRSPAGLTAAFVGLGATGAVLPASLPSFAVTLPAGQADVFLAVPALFAGLLLGVVGAALLSIRVGLPRLIAAGAALQACALAGVAAAPADTGVVVGAGVAGVGFGLVESAGVGLARRVHAGGAGPALTRLTSLVAVTAMLVPLLIVATRVIGSARGVVALCAVPHLFTAVLLLRDEPAADRTRRSMGTSGSSGSPSRAALLAPAVALFCYVGAESVVAGWSAELPRRLVGVDPAVGALGTSAFWGLLWAGRLIALVALSRGASERDVLVRAQAAGAVLLVLAATCAASQPVLSGLFLVAAIPALAPSYGLLLAAGLRRAGGAPGRTSALLVAVGALGGSALTLLASRISGAQGGVSATLAVAAGACVLSLVAAGLATRAVPVPLERPEEVHGPA